MAQTIKLKRSATSGAVPTTSALALGEMAINTHDGKVYIKKDDGTASVVEVGSLGDSVEVDTVITEGVIYSRENEQGVPLESGLAYFSFNHNQSAHPTTEAEFDLMERGSITTFKDAGTWDNTSAFTLSADSYLSEFHGYLLITTAGDYRFGVNADDSVDLFIDGIRVADDYGGHGATAFFNDSSRTSIYLSAGYHKLFARFEEVGGGDSVQLGWNAGSGTTISAIPSSVLWHNATDRLKAQDGKVRAVGDFYIGASGDHKVWHEGTLTTTNKSNYDTAYGWGNHASAGYYAASNPNGYTNDQTAAEILTAIKTVDGSGSGLDADTLDSIQASSFVRSDANDTKSGNLILQTSGAATDTATGLLFEVGGTYNDGKWRTRFRKQDKGGGIPLYIDTSSSTANVYTETVRIGTYSGNPYELEVFGDINATGNLYDGGNAVWHTGNDGSGSGLDADTLDGYQSSYFATQGNLGAYLQKAGGTMTGTTTFNSTVNLEGNVFFTNPIENFNTFTANKIHHSIETNMLAGKGSKLRVTIDGVESTAAASGLTNQSFEDWNVISATSGSSPKVINIDLVTNGLYGSNGITYSAGFVVLNFYSSPFPSGWSARVKNKDGNWTSMAMTKIGTTLRGTIPISNWITDLEFTLSSGTTGPYVTGTVVWGLCEVAYYGSRMSLSQGASITSVGGYIDGNLTFGKTSGAPFYVNSSTVVTNLNADLLDGQQGSYYYAASNPNGYTSNVGDITGVTAGTGLTGGGTSGTPTLNVIGGSGITANANDIAVDSTVFRNNSAQYLQFNTASTEALTFKNSTSCGLIQVGFQQNDTDGMHHRAYLKAWKGSTAASGNVDLIVRGTAGSLTSDVLSLRSGNASPTWRGQTIWNAGNDGSGSGLDADTLDGYQSSYFATQGNLGAYLQKSGGTLTGNVTFQDDNEGITFNGGGRFYKQSGSGLVIRKPVGGQELRFEDNSGTFIGTFWHSGNDGSGSGLDADLLDGQQGSYYYAASNPNGYTSNTGDITGVTAGTGMTGGGASGAVTLNVIGGSGITANADNITVDSTVVRTTGTQTIGGIKVSAVANDQNYIAFSGTTGDQNGNYNHTFIGERIWSGTESSELVLAKYNDVEGGSGSDRIRHVANNHVFDTYTGATSAGANASLSTAVGTGTLYTRMTIRQNGDIEVGGSKFIDSSRNLTNIGTLNGGTAWRSNNDGSGSGLDADTLDGYQSSYFATQGNLGAYLQKAGGTATGAITLSNPGNHFSGHHYFDSYDGNGNHYPHYLSGSSNNGAQVNLRVQQSGGGGYDVLYIPNGSNNITWRGNNVWNAGNDGSGSGLDADLLDGLQSAFAPTANTIPIRNANGDISARELVLSSALITATPTVLVSMYPNSNQLVRTTPAAVAAGMGAWTSSNDGSGSGLDADTLDGYQSSYFATQGNLGAYLQKAGGTMTGNLEFSNSGTTKRGIQGTCGDNDFWFFGGGATSSNAGYLEIAAGDDGSTSGSYEPIYVRQYLGAPLTGTVQRTLTLLDNSGNTAIPNALTVNGQIVADKSAATTSDAAATIISKGTVDTTTGYQPQNWHITFQDGGGTVRGKITSSHYATQYSTSSDYRLKEDIQPITDATERLLALKAVNFKWIDGQQRSDGFIAHELQEHLPEAVTGEKDATTEVTETIVADDGTETEVTTTVPEMQGIDQSKLVPLLVKTIQELEARISALENA